MAFPSKLAAGAGIVAVALAYHVRQRSARTGDDLLTSVRQLPADAAVWGRHLRARAVRALAEGRAEAAEHDAELAQRLLEAGARPEA